MVTDTPDAGLARLLAAGGLSVQARRPEQCEWSLEDLSSYAAVLIENGFASAVSGGVVTPTLTASRSVTST